MSGDGIASSQEQPEQGCCELDAASTSDQSPCFPLHHAGDGVLPTCTPTKVSSHCYAQRLIGRSCSLSKKGAAHEFHHRHRCRLGSRGVRLSVGGSLNTSHCPRGKVEKGGICKFHIFSKAVKMN